MQALTPNQLQGVWAAVPTPFTATGSLDIPALEENIRRYDRHGIPGVYTTDSDGEFYAIELDEFRRLAHSFGRAMEQTRMHAAMGVTWSSTAGMIDRAKAALDAGIPNLHIAFPFWMPLAPADVPRFFDDLATAVPETRWIHYRTRRSHILPSGRDYAAWTRQYPAQLIGTKLATSDIAEITEIVSAAPQLAHFGGEFCFVAAALSGVRGLCSFFVSALPEWMLEAWRLCEQGRWQEAMERQVKLIRWETDSMSAMSQAGHNHAIIGKARGACTGFLVESGVTRAPYYPADPALVERLRAQFASFWKEELAQERLG